MTSYERSGDGLLSLDGVDLKCPRCETYDVSIDTAVGVMTQLCGSAELVLAIPLRCKSGHLWDFILKSGDWGVIVYQFNTRVPRRS